MSLYDDLGVREGATAEEIREQYRVLVRLFHPDQFVDAALKAAAEGQMRRFNEIAAILTDPERRRQYEAEKPAPIVIHAPQAVSPSRRIPWKSIAWGTAAMACAGAIVWVSDHETLPEAPAFAMRTVVAAPSPNPSTSSSHFAGAWFYARRSEPQTKVNGPEFIETQITEEDGRMQGRYRSRYRVMDQTTPPSVNFEFMGQAEGSSAEMPFTRDDGGHGEVKLRLISEREMELDWTSTDFPAPALTSGTAILVRGQ